MWEQTFTKFFWNNAIKWTVNFSSIFKTDEIKKIIFVARFNIFPILKETNASDKKHEEELFLANTKEDYEKPTMYSTSSL